MALMTHDSSREQRQAIRLGFFREFRGEDGCTSVSIRKDRETREWYLWVGYTGSGARIDADSYGGLEVRKYAAARAVHAVQYRN